MKTTDLMQLKAETEERRDRIARQLKDDLHAVLSTASGQRFLVWILYEKCGIDKRIADERRRVGLDILDELVAYPDLAEKLLGAYADVRRSEIYYHAGMKRIREESQKKEQSDGQPG